MRFAAAADPGRSPLSASLRPLPGAALALLLASALAAPALRAQALTYSVLPGETCKEISARYWPDDARALDKFHELNPQLGPTPHKLVAGQKLNVLAPKADAHLTFLKPDVNKRVMRAPDWKVASRGDGLYRLDEVSTLKGAGAEITFSDLSAVQLEENALIVIYGDSPAPKRAQEKSGQVELVQGDAAISLSSLRGEKPMEVVTPAGRVKLHSNASRVGVDEQKMSRVSIFQGHADVAAMGKKVAVNSGYGTRVAQGKPPEPPTPLPDAPAWADGSPLSTFVMAPPTGPVTLQVPLPFAQVARGVRYRLEVARDEGFNDRLLERTLDASDLAQLVPQVELPPGAYRARVWAVDAKGLAGPPSPARKLEVVAITERGAELDESGRLHSEHDVVLDLEGAPESAVTLDGEPAVPLSARSRIVLTHAAQHVLALKGGTRTATLAVDLEPTPVPLPPPPPPPPPPLVMVAEASSARGPVGTGNAVSASGPLPTAFVDRGFSAELRLQPDLHAASRSALVLGALDVELGNGRAAIFASETIQGNPLSTGSASSLNYPTIGLRGRLLGDGERVSLSLGGDVTSNIDHSADGVELPRTRLWLALGVRYDALFLSTTQAISPAADGAGYQGSLVAGYFLRPELQLNAELQLLAEGLCPNSGCVGAVGALGLRGRIGLLELGLSLRSGLSDEGRAVWGEPAALFTLGVHLGGRKSALSPGSTAVDVLPE